MIKSRLVREKEKKKVIINVGKGLRKRRREGAKDR